MAKAPLYQDGQIETPRAPSVTLGTTPVPSFDTGEAIGGGLSTLSRAAGELALTINKARTEIDVAEATTDFLKKNHELESRAVQDQDYRNAPVNFVREQDGLIASATGRVSDAAKRAELTRSLTSHAVVSRGRVEKAALVNASDANIAALDQQELQALHDAALAGSPEEKQRAIDFYTSSAQSAAAAGTISQQNAGARVLKFNRLLEQADAMEEIRRDPVNARKLLADPARFSSLDPVTRQSYAISAAQHADQVTTDQLRILSVQHPEAATLAVGRVLTPAHGAAVFNNVIIPIESNGRVDAVSDKGALGIAQVMPGTAREVATKLGLADVAALSDEDLRKRLLSDEGLNRRLGGAYWQQMLQRYDGNVAAAMAAYNGGPGRADEWVKAARAKYGENYNAAQLSEFIHIKETREYLEKGYGRLGVPLQGAQYSTPHAWYGGFAAVASAMQEQENRTGAAVKALASTARSTDDVLQLIKQGYDIDPQRINTARAVNEAAAARGDSKAADYLRDLDQWERLAPHIRAAWKMPIGQLDQAVKQMSADVTAPGANPTMQQVETLQAFEAVLKEQQSKRDREPIVLGGENGGRFYKTRPLNANARADDVTLRATLAERGAHALVNQGIYAAPAIALTVEEQNAFKDRWAQAGPDEQFQLLQTFASALPGRAYGDTLRTIIGNDPATAFVGRIALERPALAREILQGQALLATKEVGDKAAIIKPALASKLGGELYPNPADQDAVITAALALYTSRRGRSGALYDATDSGAIEQAIEDVAGTIVKRNGVRVPVTPGLTASQFNRALDRIDATALASVGGAVDSAGKAVTLQTISEYAVLRPLTVGGARYVVGMRDTRARDGFMPLMTEGGEPLVVDMRALAAADEARRPEPTEYERRKTSVREQRIRRDEEQRARDLQ